MRQISEMNLFGNLSSFKVWTRQIRLKKKQKSYESERHLLSIDNKLLRRTFIAKKHHGHRKRALFIEEALRRSPTCTCNQLMLLQVLELEQILRKIYRFFRDLKWV